MNKSILPLSIKQLDAWMVRYSFPLKSLLKSLHKAGSFVAIRLSVPTVNPCVPKQSQGDTFLKDCKKCIWYVAVILFLSHSELSINAHNSFCSWHFMGVLPEEKFYSR